MLNEYANRVVKLYLADGKTKSGVVKVFDSANEQMFCLVDSVNAFKGEKQFLETINIPSVDEIELLEYPIYEIE